MKTTFRYFCLVFISATIASIIYYIAEQFISQYDWAKVFLFISIIEGWGYGFARWILAVIEDDRNPLAIGEL